MAAPSNKTQIRLQEAASGLKDPTTSGHWLAGAQSTSPKLGPAQALTEARRGDGVHVDLVVADLLVALSVGRGL